MKSSLGVLVVTSAVTLGAPADAAERCRLAATQSAGANVLVRHPLPDIDPSDPSHTHTNKHVVWLISEDRAYFVDELGFADPAVIAVGDFIAGGSCDLVWELQEPGPNGVTRLLVGEGFTAVAEGAFAQGATKPPYPWEIAGAFDFTNDGWADLLWWNPATNELLFWDRTPSAQWQQRVVVGGLPKPWRPVAVAQLEANGPPGVVWFYPGQNAGLYYQRAEWAGQYLHLQPFGAMSLIADPDWDVVAAGDFDGDGNEDLMRQERGVPFGRLQVCFMNGLTLRDNGCAALDPERLAHPAPEYHTLPWYVVGSR